MTKSYVPCVCDWNRKGPAVILSEARVYREVNGEDEEWTWLWEVGRYLEKYPNQVQTTYGDRPAILFYDHTDDFRRCGQRAPFDHDVVMKAIWGGNLLVGSRPGKNKRVPFRHQLVTDIKDVAVVQYDRLSLSEEAIDFIDDPENGYPIESESCFGMTVHGSRGFYVYEEESFEDDEGRTDSNAHVWMHTVYFDDLASAAAFKMRLSI